MLSAAEREMPVEDDMRDEVAVFTEHNIWADRAVRADGAGCRNLRAGSDDRCRVDAAGRSLTRAILRGRWRRSCDRLPGGAIGQRAHDSGFAGQFAVDGCDAAQPDGGCAPVEDSDFDTELIAGNDRLAELGLLDAGEDHELGVAVRNLGEEQRAASLRDGFDD